MIVILPDLLFPLLLLNASSLPGDKEEGELGEATLVEELPRGVEKPRGEGSEIPVMELALCGCVPGPLAMVDPPNFKRIFAGFCCGDCWGDSSSDDDDDAGFDCGRGGAACCWRC